MSANQNIEANKNTIPGINDSENIGLISAEFNLLEQKDFKNNFSTQFTDSINTDIKDKTCVSEDVNTTGPDMDRDANSTTVREQSKAPLERPSKLVVEPEQTNSTTISEQSNSPLENLSELVVEPEQTNRTIVTEDSNSLLEHPSELVVEPEQTSSTTISEQSNSPLENLSELVVEPEQTSGVKEKSLEDLLQKMPLNVVTRSQIIIESMIFNKYHYVHSDGTKLLFAKRTLSGFNIYLAKNGNYIGKMRANIFGTKYTYGTLLEIKYETSFLDKSKPRSFKVKLDGLELINKKPYFNTETNSFSLNFSGRVTKPSVKNFQIVHPLEQTYITLTFGKEEINSYILDYSHPWSILSAFCVGLSALDHKFGCE